ncbi:MAG TPA: phenol hydroxylase subunit P4 [Phycicoccus sp.]|nr:phenol hydroxylase subunit P4 [Phycicoccus sp.]
MSAVLQDTIERPEIKSIGEYNFPSKSAQALYGDDMLLHVWWKGNPWFVAAACYRVPQAMTFGEFWEGVFVPYHSEDPDFNAEGGWGQFSWFIGNGRASTPISPSADVTLADLGLTHKSVLGFTGP